MMATRDMVDVNCWSSVYSLGPVLCDLFLQHNSVNLPRGAYQNLQNRFRNTSRWAPFPNREATAKLHGWTAASYIIS